MKKSYLLFLSIGVLAACGAEEKTGDQGADVGKDTYVVGLDDTFAPMGFRNEEGELVGFDVELAEAVGELMDVSFTFQPIDWVLKETELNTGNIDFIWNGYSITDERKEKVAFSDPYLDNKQIIVTKVGSDIDSKEELAGKVVATQQGSATLDALEADTTGIVDQFDGGEPILYPTFTDVFNDLDAGRSDAIVVDEVLGRYIMKQKGADQYKVLSDDFGDEEYGIGVRKEDDALLEELNEALETLKENGTFEEIYQNWFAE